MKKPFLKAAVVSFQLCATGMASVLMSVACAHADGASPWGVSPSAALSTAPDEWVQSMVAAGVTAVRGYDYRRGKAGLATFRDAGLDVSAILAWHSESRPGLPVDDIPEFQSYVRQTLRTYGEYIKYWELWNEPPNTTGDPVGANYGRVVAAAYDAAKAADPAIQLGLAAKSVHIRYLAEAITGGAKGKFDFISLHPYETAALLAEGWELPFLGIVGNVRAMLRDSNPEKADVPVWFTEVGIEADARSSLSSEEQQADLLVKIYVLSLAQGVSHVHWFDPRDSEGRHLGLLRHDGSERPAYKALATLSHALGAKPLFEGFVEIAADTYGFLFAGRQADSLVAWSHSGKPHKLVLQGEVTALGRSPGERRNVLSPTIAARPLILSAPGDSAVAQDWRQRATASVPQAWSCAEREGKAVFVPGRRACGLHLARDANASVRPRQSGLNLAGTTGAAFAVDPQYVGYSDQALEITAVVRGHGRGDPGFNLKYEAGRPLSVVDDNGMVGVAGWNHINGERPVTLRWLVKDARFVGKYGINLRVDCDVPQHCDFSLLSLSVRKLEGSKPENAD